MSKINLQPTVCDGNEQLGKSNQSKTDFFKDGQIISQARLVRKLEIEGYGLHTGQKSAIVLHPSEIGSGIHFLLKNNSEVIPAHYNRVTLAHRASILLGIEGSKIYTVEHIMSCLAAFNLFDLTIEIIGNEIPILDGSAKAWVDLIINNLEYVSKNATALKIIKEFSYKEENSSITFYPQDKIEYMVDISFDHPLIGVQSYSHIMDTKQFISNVANSRTFGFQHELNNLRKKGLINGGSLKSALVFDSQNCLNPDGMRYPDECVRHKLLDLMGDLALLGAPIIGKIEAVRPGHRFNNQALKALIYNNASWIWQ